MELLETLTVFYGSEPRTIELHHGDLTNLRPEEAADILVVSAFRGNYWPVPGTLIGALEQKGVSVEDLANDKAVDLLETCSCWLSKELRNPPDGIRFKKILCFEPGEVMRATELVGDIFRSLVPFLPPGSATTTVAMPIVNTGSMGLPASPMLEAILDAATHWMALGLPLRTLKIVVYSPQKVQEVRGTFVRWRESHTTPDLTPAHSYRYDVFISYSHSNKDKVDWLVKQLQSRRPNLRIFLDRLELNPGAAWQQQIFEALDDCRHVVAFYSPEYLKSAICQEEFHIARFRERNLGEKLLFPILLYDVKLPSFMAVIQYEDCREGDEDRLRNVSAKILDRLRQ